MHGATYRVNSTYLIHHTYLLPRCPKLTSVLSKRTNSQTTRCSLNYTCTPFIMLPMEWKVLGRTSSNTNLSVTFMDFSFFIIQSKLTFISTLSRYLQERYEVFHKLCKVIKQAFVHWKSISVTQNIRQSLDAWLPPTSSISHFRHRRTPARDQ